MIISRKAILFLSMVFVTVGLSIALFYSAVDNSLSDDDKQYIPKYLVNIDPLKENPQYKDELTYIISVQHSVLNIVSGFIQVPYGEKREAKELYVVKSGLCYDRSRVIEKILRYSGFKTRHIAIFSKEKTGSAFKSLMTPGTPSHAITEVLTKNGWLVVDSNAAWVSVDSNMQPVSIDTMHQSIENSTSINWSQDPPFHIYKKPFINIYGLYGRHGNFYPPYNFIPDIHYGEFMRNFF